MHPNRIVDATPTQLLYDCDTTGGQSGSPVIHWDGSTQFTVVGIHNQGSPQVNFASRITTAALAKLREWKQAGM
jgi:V8-like Glu-specific endopeptidase